MYCNLYVEHCGYLHPLRVATVTLEKKRYFLPICLSTTSIALALPLLLRLCVIVTALDGTGTHGCGGCHCQIDD